MSDVNDNAPIFQSNFINLTLSEGLPLETAVLNLVATDSDFGANGQVNYTILNEQSDASGLITEGIHVFFKLSSSYIHNRNLYLSVIIITSTEFHNL